MFPNLMTDEHVFSGLIRARILSAKMFISEERFFEFADLPYHWLRPQVPLCQNLAAVINKYAHDSEQFMQTRLNHTPVLPWLLSLESDDLSSLNDEVRRPNIEENAFAVNRCWKFCIKCATEERKNLGFSYWHSSHQSLAVVTCSVHKTALYTHEALRYQKFSLPYEWIDKAEPIALSGPWHRDWQPFIYQLNELIRDDLMLPSRLRESIRKALNIPSKIKYTDKPFFESLFRNMRSDIGDECLAGLFTCFAKGHQKETNILWTTLSGKSKVKGLRHPLYWLTILFWLRNKLPELQCIRYGFTNY